MRSNSTLFACIVVLLLAEAGRGAVVLNEIFINPPGSLDDTREYIELLGPPGMKLDGYAIAVVNGGLERLFPLGTIPPLPAGVPEIDELFSLDGLELGANGLLVVAVAASFNYPQLLSDTEFRGHWATIWNGGLDVPGQLQNDGSNSILLVRNRPGRTEANPLDPLGLVWGKHRFPDAELITPVIDPQDQMEKDQWGDGDFDEGQPNGIGGLTVDFAGASTPADFSDDLEIVDEVSYEHERGWEYDTDGRYVDLFSESAGLPQRRVHALDDPQGFNPDSLSRVDTRTTGAGWAPVFGATGELANGNNWQDTATEQWVRGETVVLVTPQGPEFYYNNAPVDNPDSIQPYSTNVPKWLADGTAPDYDFGAPRTYPITPGRVNPLAHPMIPGDADRDGDVDSSDIAKIAAVFGDEDWVFSNAHDRGGAGDSGDPAQQTRPWDVDFTGDNGVDSSDLQWALNFQGDLTGRIVGVRYDSPQPSEAGVVLHPAEGLGCKVDVLAQVHSGRPLDALIVGDTIELTVSAEVTQGAVDRVGERNGVMQFVHDVLVARPGTVRVITVEVQAPFQSTRSELVEWAGTEGDLGVLTVNGYALGFTAGLRGLAALYKVRCEVIGAGATTLEVRPTAHARLASASPHGIKVGHTADYGNPGGVEYPTAISISAVQPAAGNCDADPQLSLEDYACFVACLGGPEQRPAPACAPFDLDADGDVDLADYGGMQIHFGR